MKNLFVIMVLALLGVGSVNAATQNSQEIPNFSLLDLNGRIHELHRVKAKVLVLFFTGNGCPIARQSSSSLRELRKAFGGKGTQIWVVNSYADDDNQSIRREAREFGFQGFPIMKDRDQALAVALNVQRTAEVIAIETKGWTVIYRGAIDDQLSEGEKKPAPENRYLATALEEYFAGREITTTQTKPKGCLIAFENGGKEISYVKDVAPILQQKCANCHSEGNIGPFAYNSYSRAKTKSRMMQEVLLTRRMPPWHADPHYGKFQNDRSLTAQEVQTLLRWAQQGAPRDEGEDPLKAQEAKASDWVLGTPDYILKLPSVQKIPATGVLDYRHIQLENPIEKDVWLGAIAIKPGNLKVVHHVILRAAYRGGEDDGSGRGVMVSGWAPGYFPERYPENAGRFIPKGAKFNVELHYNTMGSEQSDATEIGLYVLKEKPLLEFRVQAAINTDFSIPPGERDARTFATYGFQKDAFLYAMSPHMHLRGSWFKYEALYPDGSRETLLSVPNYDFNWQTEYRFETPKRMPKGTWILCTGAFDNSGENPSNPDAKQRVTWGDQSFEEMFIGFMDIADVPEGWEGQIKNAKALSSKD